MVIPGLLQNGKGSADRLLKHGKEWQVAEILNGKEVASGIRKSVGERAALLRRGGVIPCLEVIRCSENPADISYERGIRSVCVKTGIEVRPVLFSSQAGQEEVAAELERAGHDSMIHGVILLRPLPESMDSRYVVNSLVSSKDVDGMTDTSLESVFTGNGNGFAPCTPEAVLKILDYYNIGTDGRNVVIVGRSLVFGRPVSMLFLQRNATVTICHSHTRSLPEITRKADILVTSAGQARLIGPEFVREGQTVIDVSINTDKDGRLCGDVDFENVGPLVSYITPVPGGVGAVTSAVLAEHVVEAAERRIRN